MKIRMFESRNFILSLVNSLLTDTWCWSLPFFTESFYCNKTDNGHFLKPLTDNLEVLYVVKNSSKRNAGVPYDSKLQNV